MQAGYEHRLVEAEPLLRVKGCFFADKILRPVLFNITTAHRFWRAHAAVNIERYSACCDRLKSND
jgi:hypothetical protein